MNMEEGDQYEDLDEEDGGRHNIQRNVRRNSPDQALLQLHQRSEELGLQHRTIVANPGYNYVQVAVP